MVATTDHQFSRQMAQARLAWCEHGWSFWQFHLWAFILSLVGYSKIIPDPSSAIFFTGLGLLALGGLAFFRLSAKGFFLWLLGGCLGLCLRSQEPITALMSLWVSIFGLWHAWPFASQGDRLSRRMLFKVNARLWVLFRLLLGLSLVAVWVFIPPTALDLAFFLQGLLAFVFLLAGWLRLGHVEPWIPLEKAIVFLSVLVLAVGFAHSNAPSAPLLLAFVAAFDLRVWPPKRLTTPHQEIIFFDDTCSLCQGAAAFVLVEDHRSTPLFFAAQQSPLFEKILFEKGGSEPSTTLYVLSAQGDWLAGDRAIIYILQSLGGLWLPLAYLLQMMPPRLLGALYALVARFRHAIRPLGSSLRWPDALAYRLKK